jgi:hypothetical protein
MTRGDAGQALGPAQLGSVAPLKGVLIRLLCFSRRELINAIDGVERGRSSVLLLTAKSTMPPVVTP